MYLFGEKMIVYKFFLTPTPWPTYLPPLKVNFTGCLEEITQSETEISEIRFMEQKSSFNTKSNCNEASITSKFLDNNFFTKLKLTSHICSESTFVSNITVS